MTNGILHSVKVKLDGIRSGSTKGRYLYEDALSLRVEGNLIQRFRKCTTHICVSVQVMDMKACSRKSMYLSQQVHG